MEDEIKVGEYVRSLVNGRISKVLEISDLLEEPGIKYYKTGNLTGFCSTENYQVKHSFNIIDLIEVGDYVNGEQVVGKDNNCILLLTDKGQTYLRNIFESKYIKSIVTKEQFEAIEYKVKE